MSEKLTYHQTDKDILRDDEVVLKSQKDPREFAPLYDKYFLQIFNYVYKRVYDTNEADEITSLIFAKALKRIKQYKSKGFPFGSWLFQIARNEVVDYFRKNQKNQCLSVSLDELNYLMDSADEDNSLIEEKENKTKKIINALTELNAEDLELIELRFFEDRSFSEIADILKIKETNARVKTHRAIAKLKDIIKK
ncbi:sigma-70 family RNA polymerase sigma factor [Vicingus serpentipes]|uniref:Sigma-70 family RNA polymerase sigma factor n=1 Tax=Vicingus serpentipes TaxID=1926625 RepID=A0A5C6RV18_9FLAO|nr:sigma-70 family RNA polymerase sigma factor [Vicingus serpentipes]TXB66191.1 sigma-70 family RNA polymerase sigma factor [Vicingus serpentipes]